MSDMNDRFDDELMAKARRLATDVQPERDLWPDIAAALDESAPRPGIFGFSNVLAQAAAVLLLVGGSSGLTYLAVSGDRAGNSPVATTQGLEFETVAASFGSRYSLGPDFVDARRDLEARLSSELERLSPEAREDVLRSLEEIRGAIREINTALAAEPDNALLQDLLLSSYRKELQLMRSVNGLAGSSMYREDI